MKSSIFAAAVALASGTLARIPPYPIAYGTGASKPTITSSVTPPFPIIHPHNSTTSSTLHPSTKTTVVVPPPPSTTISSSHQPEPSIFTQYSTVVQPTTITVTERPCGTSISSLQIGTTTTTTSLNSQTTTVRTSTSSLLPTIVPSGHPHPPVNGSMPQMQVRSEEQAAEEDYHVRAVRRSLDNNQGPLTYRSSAAANTASFAGLAAAVAAILIIAA